MLSHMFQHLSECFPWRFIKILFYIFLCINLTPPIVAQPTPGIMVWTNLNLHLLAQMLLYKKMFLYAFLCKNSTKTVAPPYPQGPWFVPTWINTTFLDLIPYYAVYIFLFVIFNKWHISLFTCVAVRVCSMRKHKYMHVTHLFCQTNYFTVSKLVSFFHRSKRLKLIKG